MSTLRHGEFIAKMAKYKAKDIWKDYRERHANDPQIPALAHETHYIVCNLSQIVDMTSLETIRKGLCEKYKSKSLTESLNHKHAAPRVDLIKIMKASGLKWFELDGVPVIHWNEKP